MSEPEERAEPSTAPAPSLRASDADRERVAAALRDGAAEGRLDLEELAERVERAYAARTAAELEPLTADLPASSRAPGGEAGAAAERTSWIVNVMSGSRRRGRWRLARRLNIVSLMGGVRLDLRAAELESGRATITVVSVMGGLHVDVPEGIDLRVSGLSIMGGRRVDEPARPPGPGAPVVDLRVFGIMGGTRVRVRGRGSGEIEA